MTDTDPPAEPMPPWYVDWAAHHIRVFALKGETAKAVVAWWPVFTRLFTDADLRAATDALLASPADLQWAADHRRALIAEVDAARNRDRAKRRAEGGPDPCGQCGDTGWVAVPHPGCVPGGGHLLGLLRKPADDPTGLTRELAVTCTCLAGERTAAAEAARDRPPLTLLAYMRRYPNWPEVEFERKQVLDAARAPVEDADFATLLARLADRAKLPPRNAHGPPRRAAA